MSNREHLIKSIEDAFSSSGGYFRINKRAVKAFGWDKAIYISLMMEKARLHAIKQGVDWFFYRNDNLLEDAQFGPTSRHKIAKFKKYFEEAGILESKMEGLPLKQWFRMNPLKLSEFIEKKINSSSRKEFNGLRDKIDNGLRDDSYYGERDNIERRDNEIEYYKNNTTTFSEKSGERKNKKSFRRRNSPVNKNTSTSTSASASASTISPDNRKEYASAFNPKKNSPAKTQSFSAADEKYVTLARDLTELWNCAADCINSEFAPPKKLTRHQAEGKSFRKRVQLVKDAVNGNLQKRMSKNGWLKRLDEEEREQVMKTKLNETKLEWLISEKMYWFFNPDKNKSSFQPGKHPTTLNDFFLNHNNTSWAFLLFNLKLNGNGRSQAAQSLDDLIVTQMSDELELALTVDVGRQIKDRLDDVAEDLFIWFENYGKGNCLYSYIPELEDLKESLANGRIPHRGTNEGIPYRGDWTVFSWLGWHNENEYVAVDFAKDYAEYVSKIAEENGYTVSPRGIEIGGKLFFMYIDNYLAPKLRYDEYMMSTNPFGAERVKKEIQEIYKR